MKIHQVTESIYRGPAPTEPIHWQQLRDRKIKVVLNLQSGNQNEEVRNALGCTMYPLEVECSSWVPPNQKQRRLAIDILTEYMFFPVYVHCHKGVDRTGVIIRDYRHSIQGWPKERADEEAKDMGMHWWCYWWLR